MNPKKAIRNGLFVLFMVLCIGCKQTATSEVNTSGINMIPFHETIYKSDEEPVTNNNETNNTDSKTVYICKSAGAKRYHYDESCRGLKRCKHTIEKVTVKKAEGFGLTPCGYEK